jgi:transposase
MLELIVDHQAGIPILMQPLSGNTNDSVEVGRGVTEHVQQLCTAHRLTYWVADRALYNAEHLRKLTDHGVKWLTRVPATRHEVQAGLAHVAPEAMVPLTDGYRYHELASTYGGIPQQWVVVYAEARRERAGRTVATQWRLQSDAELKACKPLCRTAFACIADAQQALETFQQGLQVTRLAESTLRSRPRYDTRGRPRPGTTP